MAVVACIGFELNSVTSAEELTTVTGATITSTSPISGTFSGLISSLASGTAQLFRFQFAPSAANVFYFSFWYRPDTLPSAENRIFVGNNANNLTSPEIYLTIDNTGVLKLYDEDGQIGSASSALSTGTAYLIQIAFDRSAAAGSHVVSGYVDTVQFATASNRSIAAGIFSASWGGNLNSEAQTTGQWLFDDIVINDNTGSFSTLPGNIRLLDTMKPNAAGDSNQWLDTAGSAGTTNNYTLVDETNPNDATDFVQSGTANDQDLYNLQNTGTNISASDTMHFAAVGVRYRNDVADATTAFRMVIEKEASGTKLESASIVPKSTAWQSNGNNQPRVQPLIAYTDPDGAAWTKPTLNSCQVGPKLQTANVNKVQVSCVWVYFCFTPATSLIKTWNGIPIASVKTINGIPIASVKTLNGITNV